MIVTGVQPVGARSLGAVQATVTDASPRVGAIGTPTSERESAPATRAAQAEVVVFPRDGKPLDQRPVQLRFARAAERYREDGGRRKERRPRS